MTVIDSRWICEPFGINNQNNVCFINSMIQFLLSSPYVNRILLTECDMQNRLQHILHIVLKHVINKSGIIITYKTAQFVCKILNVSYDEQNDMMEFLGKSIEIINNKQITDMFKNEYECYLVCKDCGESKKIANEENIFIQIDTDNIDENGILNSFHNIDGVKCEKCKNENLCKKNILSYLPANMIFMHRLRGNVLKNKLVFNLKSGRFNYILVSMVEFFGSNNYGHYTAISTRKCGIFRNNDEHIMKVNSFQSNNSYASMYIIDSIDKY